jgi:hypothetical protein
MGCHVVELKLEGMHFPRGQTGGDETKHLLPLLIRRVQVRTIKTGATWVDKTGQLLPFERGRIGSRITKTSAADTVSCLFVYVLCGVEMGRHTKHSMPLRLPFVSCCGGAIIILLSSYLTVSSVACFPGTHINTGIMGLSLGG